MRPTGLILGVLGLLTGVVSLIVSFIGYPVWGFVAAGVAVPLALGGLAFATSRKAPEGWISGIAGLVAVLGIAVGLLGAMGIMSLNTWRESSGG